VRSASRPRRRDPASTLPAPASPPDAASTAPASQSELRELLLLVIWEIASERPLTYEVWVDERTVLELPR
jgi:hypothetical protein